MHFSHCIVFQVRVRVSIQSHRQPPQFSFGPWSEYVQVQGTVTHPSTTSATPLNNPRRLLLIGVLVPVGVIILVVVLVGVLTLLSCWYRRK